ncbi:cephalotoxin-like protein [Myripristis murdjan]|uniref:Cephalotoxin-like protein n=1 Tax=Myripristis murdjan TaxID=586833 RepID=A0A667ZQB2_9TELE|nr:cephalotoxin-like protein [Myripristis murdjan]
MAVLRVSLLLGSLILLFCWTTTSALSHDPTFSTTNSRPPTRIRRDLTYLTQEKTKEVMDTGKSALEAFKSTFDVLQETKTLSGIMEKISKFSGLVPGIGGLMLSFVSMVLIFIPQESPTDQLQADLDEVNRKLDSLSIQISNLATDVEWHNYASVYSQDEVRILNAWKKLNEFLKSSRLPQSNETRIRVAEMFTTFYENTATEGSVASLYHYLTVRGTSLSKNLLDILTRKFKCDFDDVAMYAFYFNSLLYRGMVLNQFYWSLMGFDTSVKAAEHTSMMKQVVSAEKKALNYCLNNYKEYMKRDVEEISKAQSYGNKTQTAFKIKNALDKKYFWYNWVVVVYDTKQYYPDKTDGFTVIPMEKITAAVGFTNKTKIKPSWNIDSICYAKVPCSNNRAIAGVGNCYVELEYTDYVFRNFSYIKKKLWHVSYDPNSGQAPKPKLKRACQESGGSLSFYYSMEEPVCTGVPCMNGGTCQKILESNDWMCDCPDGYYGERCENSTVISQPPRYLVPHPVPVISTIEGMLKNMQSTLKNSLDQIYSLLKRRG